MKNLLKRTKSQTSLFKFDLKMKISALLLLTSIFVLQANESYSQRTRVTLDLNNITVEQLIDEIEDKTEFRFLYLLEDVDLKRIVSVKAKREKVNSILNRVFSDTETTYQIDDRQISLIKRVRPEIKAKEQTQSPVQGTVTDENGQPLPGASIAEKGTTNGTQSDFDGNYSLTVADENAVLIISYIGFETKEIEVNGQSTIDVSLGEDVSGLDEVILIGYGTVKKSDLTGSVAQVKSEDLVQIPTSGLNQAIQGRMAGVQVTQGSSAPGGGVSVSIRGINSINGNNAPLYVIDGFPLLDAGGTGTPGGGAARTSSFNPLSSINVNDIESIEVLKDASATAIYGSRGANGVVLVTTKQGKSGVSSITYDGYYGVQQVSKKYDLLNAREYAELTNERRISDGDPILFGGDDPAFPAPPQLGEGTDWQDQIFRTAAVQNHQLSLSGGNEKMSHFISFGYFDQEGVVQNTGLKRASLRANVTGKHQKWLNYGLNMNYSHTQNQLAQVEGAGFGENSSIIAAALGMSPHYSPYPDSEGLYQWMEIENTALLDNPMSLIYNNEDDVVKNYFFGNAFLDFRILEGFNFRVDVGATVSNSDRDIFYPSNSRFGSTYDGMAQKSFTSSNSWLNENTLSYIKTFNEIHDFSIVAGFSFQGRNFNSLRTAQSIQFPQDIIRYDLSNAVDFLGTNRSDKFGTTLASYYGRLNYGLDDKYLFSLTARRDGSSTFGANNKWALFPALAVAWRAINEGFIRDLNIFSDLKFRQSYGTSGNSGGAFQTLPRLAQSFYVLGDDNTVTGFSSGNIPNQDLRWELTTTFNYGMDVGFFKDRLRFTADYYIKETTDLLLDIPISTSSGFGSIRRNLGKLENKGFEFAVDAIPFDKGFKWRLNANISFNSNEVLDLGEGVDDFFFPIGPHPNLNGTLVRVGEPLGQWVEYEWDGIFSTPAELASGPIENVNTGVGDARYVDQNGDGIINSLDRVIIGNPEPDFYYGFSNNFSYKNLELNVFIQGVQGGDILNMTNEALIKSTPFTNQLTSVIDRWTPTNTNAEIPRNASGRNGVLVSSNNIEDGTFVRLKNVTLAYNLKNIKFMKSARIHISGTNLLTITDYTGFDPEVSASLGRLSRNIDNFSYPNFRTFTLGFTAKF